MTTFKISDCEQATNIGGDSLFLVSKFTDDGYTTNAVSLNTMLSGVNGRLDEIDGKINEAIEELDSL